MSDRISARRARANSTPVLSAWLPAMPGPPALPCASSHCVNARLAGSAISGPDRTPSSAGCPKAAPSHPAAHTAWTAIWKISLRPGVIRDGVPRFKVGARSKIPAARQAVGACGRPIHAKFLTNEAAEPLPDPRVSERRFTPSHLHTLGCQGIQVMSILATSLAALLTGDFPQISNFFGEPFSPVPHPMH